MKSTILLAATATALIAGVEAWLEPPPTTANPNTHSLCSYWAVAVEGDTCVSIASNNVIDLADFKLWNPSIVTTCTLMIQDSYCIEVNYGIPAPGPSTTPTKPPTTSATPTGNGVTTLTPTQERMVQNCNKFYFVKVNEGCPAIVTTNGISLANLYAWNPAVGANCNTIWAETYICVGVVGFTTSSKTTPTTVRTTTTKGNGISTPTPYLPGSYSNCDVFDQVKTGENCASIAKARGVSLADFMRFNPGINADCTTGLWLDYFVCVSIIGHSLTTVTTKTTIKPTTTKGNGISTPTPTQPGMVTNCNKFDRVYSGETCKSIATLWKITMAQFLNWNKDVGGTACNKLWLNAHVCVGVL